MNHKLHAIAIDGPVAAGKGTIAKLLSSKLNGFNLNTGAMYRCVALYCMRRNVPMQKADQVIAVLPEISIDLEDEKVFLNEEDVTEEVKKREVSQISAKVAAIREVREAMVRLQQEIGLKKMAKGMVVVAEGRDAATKIFPNAKLKVFLTARPEIRAKRRFEQMGGKDNHTITFDQILLDTNDRDYKDINRKESPLVSDPKAHGYVVLDNSDINEEQTVEAVLKEWEKVTA